ncbi:glycosyltransferase family 4 protein [Flaviramulus aquimarinus]|uniref:Glycosyltransferase family 4 protein n=1 Tax=Flaviramulus aquimarinus TaxID=1170456 RepID=A0ABP9FFI6_9FLAO
MTNFKKNISILNITLAGGGAEKVISLLLKKLINDYNVTLFLLYNDIHYDIPKEVTIVILNNQNASNKFGYIKKILAPIILQIKFLRELKRRKINISISFLAYPNFLNSIASIRYSKLKTVISERGYPSMNTTSKISFYISKIFYPILYNRNDVLFSNSIYINKDLKENFKVKLPLKVIYNPIIIPSSNVLQNTIVPKEEDLKVVTVGNLFKSKNQKMIINAISLLKGGYKLSVYGEGPYKQSLKDLINVKKMSDSVFLEGKVKNINHYLIKHDCFVLSSLNEGFPNALLEAMAIGLPCISTNCLSGPLELLNKNSDPITIKEGSFYKGAYGLLVNNNDEKGLAEALNYYKENPSIRSEYGKLANQKAKEFELDNIYKKFKELINF